MQKTVESNVGSYKPIESKFLILKLSVKFVFNFMDINKVSNCIERFTEAKI